MLGGPLRFVKAASSAAYKQLPLPPEQGRLAAITLRDPQPGSLGAFLPNTQLFGRTTAGLQYSCPSRFIAALAAGLLKSPLMD